MSKSGSQVATGLILLFAFGANSWAEYSGGFGTEAEPYEIGTVADWEDLMDTSTDWDKHFVLTADIDLNDVAITPIAPDIGPWEGYQGTAFAGVFDGNNHVIRNPYIGVAAGGGLFGCVAAPGQVKNLGLEGGSVFAQERVGGLVGLNWGGTIINCYSTASVSGISEGVGGLVGWNYGIIINCYSTGWVSGGRLFVGGLVGENDDHGRILNCHSTGTVDGGNTVGGLVGYNNGGAIANCYSTGPVSGYGYRSGLVGRNAEGAITNSFWDVNSCGLTTSDGGTGKTTAEMQELNTFLDAGWDFVAETANGTSNFWQMPEAPGYPVVSTFSGYTPAELSGSGTEAAPYIVSDSHELGAVWYRPSAHYLLAGDIDLSGMSWSAPIVPSFSGVFDGNDHTLHNAEVNMPGGSLVGLFGHLSPDGQIKNLSAEDSTIVGGNYVGGLVAYNHDGIISDCNSTGSVTGVSNVGGIVGWNEFQSSISNCYSGGSVRGKSNVGGLIGWNDYSEISNCYSSGSVSGADYVGGLIGYNYSNFHITISNCHSTVSASGSNYVGGLVGYNDRGDITHCYSTGSVSGDDYVGGLVGYDDDGTIANCNSTGSVSGGDDYVGGLVGYDDYGTIKNSYSTGSASGGDDYVGGLAGMASGIIVVINCYSTGSVSGDDYVGGLVGRSDDDDAVRDSFWDVNTSDWATSAGGTPKTTAEMKSESTFNSAGWDFVGESGNGADDVWAICEGMNYPRLVWEVPLGDWVCPDGVGFEDFSYLGGFWGSGDGGGVDLDGEDGIGFGDLTVFCEGWLRGR